MTVIGGGDKANRAQTFMNLLKVGIGPGCLALPFAFAKCGIVMATVILIAMSLMVYRNMLAIVKAKGRLKKMHPEEQVLSFGDMARITIGDRAALFVDIVLCSMQMGICTVYFRFIPTNLHATIHSIPERTWLRYTVPFMIGLSWIKSLKHLAPFSTFANLATLITVMTVIGFAVGIMLDNGQPAESVTAVEWRGAPIFYGIAIYSFEGCGAVLAIHESMADPSEFSIALRQAGGVVFGCFIMTGMICYLSFGDITNGSITAELGHRTHNNVLNFLNLLIAIAVGLTYPVQAYPAIEVIERGLGIRIVPSNDASSANGLSSKRVQQMLLRTMFVLSTALAAATVKNLGLIAALFGAINGSIIALILPPVLDMKSKSSSNNVSAHERLLDYASAAAGVVGGLSGTMVVINDIITDHHNQIE